MLINRLIRVHTSDADLNYFKYHTCAINSFPPAQFVSLFVQRPRRTMMKQAEFISSGCKTVSRNLLPFIWLDGLLRTERLTFQQTRFSVGPDSYVRGCACVSLPFQFYTSLSLDYFLFIGPNRWTRRTKLITSRRRCSSCATTWFLFHGYEYTIIQKL